MAGGSRRRRACGSWPGGLPYGVAPRAYRPGLLSALTRTPGPRGSTISPGRRVRGIRRFLALYWRTWHLAYLFLREIPPLLSVSIPFGSTTRAAVFMSSGFRLPPRIPGGGGFIGATARLDGRYRPRAMLGPRSVSPTPLILRRLGHLGPAALRRGRWPACGCLPRRHGPTPRVVPLGWGGAPHYAG